MNYFRFISIISIFIISQSPTILTQQPYIKRATTSCHSTNNSTSVLGYTCNGLHKACRAYLTFRAQPPHNSISTISSLFSITPTKLSNLNKVPVNATFATNRVILVPVRCSCSGIHYQANTSYIVQHHDTPFLIANNTFQGLTTCQALRAGQKSNFTRNLYTGTRIKVPVRCACPTTKQTHGGVKYLLTYLVTWGQSVSGISRMFGVDTGSTLAANSLSEQDFNIFPFTTLLVPLDAPPSASRIVLFQPPPSPPSATPVPPRGGGSRKAWIYAVVGGVVGVVLVAGGMFVFLGKRRREDGLVISSSPANCEPVESKDSQNFLETLSRIADLSIKVYTIQEIEAATQDFSPGCLIKGTVYRGTINGDRAAIKRMNGDVTNEIKLLNKINHFNIIRLSGVCLDKGHWYFVYEYAANGLLSDWIHCNEEQKVLSWNERLRIALDIATGLNYLHNYTSPPHVHKDLNSSNVLLDQDLRAKITNLGLARSGEGQDGHFALTRHIVGTQGYMGPEYLDHGSVSPKLDVYAFGVVMLEIFTGKEVSDLYQGVEMELSEVLAPVLNEGDGEEKLRNMMDPSLQGKYPSDVALSVLELIDNCLKKDPSDRPAANDICRFLPRISDDHIA